METPEGYGEYHVPVVRRRRKSGVTLFLLRIRNKFRRRCSRERSPGTLCKVKSYGTTSYVLKIPTETEQ